jgi:hypothetical protein
MTEARFMGVFGALLGAFLVMGCIMRWPFFVEGRKFKRMAAIHPALPFVFYGAIGALMLVLGLLLVAGLWRGGLDFGPQ